MSADVSVRPAGGAHEEPAPSRAQQKAHALGLTSATGLVAGGIVGTGVLFSMWVTFAAGYASVYQALIVVLLGVVLHPFINAARQPAAEAPEESR